MSITYGELHKTVTQVVEDLLTTNPKPHTTLSKSIQKLADAVDQYERHVQAEKRRLDSVWVVTTVPPKDMEHKARAWGWYDNLEEAQSEIKNAPTWFAEAGFYQWIVVEGTPPGVGATAREEHWFQLDAEKKQWVPCDKPEHLESTICFGLG